MGKFTKDQIEIMRKAYGTLSRMNPSSPTYKKFIKFLGKLPKDQLKQLANAKIKFVSILAKNRIKGESVSESMDDLVIKRGLELSLKGAGFKVKKFKQKKPGYNEIWAGEFSTKNALLPFSYSKYGDVFFNTRKGSKNIGKLNSSRLLDWLKSIKSNNKWAESVDEAPIATRAILKQ